MTPTVIPRAASRRAALAEHARKAGDAEQADGAPVTLPTHMDFSALLAQLRCPVCRAEFEWLAARLPASARGPYGVLRCACNTYPVVDGVPVLTRGSVSVRSIADNRVVGGGPAAEALVAQIEAGQGEAALASLLAFPICPWPLSAMRLGRIISQLRPIRAASIALRRRTVRRWLNSALLTAEDWMSLFYWRSPTLYDPFNYFFFRFAQPRQLATLALSTTLPAGRPVLDLACGYGHLLHNLTLGEKQHEAIGVDQNFHQAWIAQHWIAPRARFVCADADGPLPFADASFGGALCVDAFHYLHDKAACLGELRRCTRGGTLILARVGNARVPPNEGEELDPEGYASLLQSWSHRVYDEDALVDSYLRGETPDAAGPTPLESVSGSKWLYFIASADGSTFSASTKFNEWPHAAGRLTVNPIFDVSSRGKTRALRFRFPSPWYAFENARMSSYHAPEAMLAEDVLAQLGEGRPGGRVDELTRRFVVMGLPEQYSRVDGRPWTMHAHRALAYALNRRALRA